MRLLLGFRSNENGEETRAFASVGPVENLGEEDNIDDHLEDGVGAVSSEP